MKVQETRSPRRSRRWHLAAVALLALTLLGAAWWFVWVPNWRPSLRDGERYGIDVSAHQGDISWERVADDGISFAYIKATEGGDFVDDRFNHNWRQAASAGIQRGAYHFFTLCRPGHEQAQNFLRVAAPTSGALPPAVDLELAGNCSERPPREEVESELDDFLEIVEAAWRRDVVLYVGNDWESLYPTRSRMERPLWIRRFLVRPDDHWFIWQLHGYARVDGVQGGVDLDVMRTADALQQD